MAQAEVYKLASSISAWSVSIPIFLGILKIKSFNRTIWTLFIYLLLCLAAEIASLFLLERENITNMVFNSFTIVEASLICYIYSQQYSKIRTKRVIEVLFLVFLILALYFFALKDGFDKVDEKVRTFEAGIITLLSGMFFYKFMLDDSLRILSKHYFYWINLSFIIYFSTALLLFMNDDFLEHCKPTTAYILWGLHLLLNVATNILLSIGIWKLEQKPL